MRLLSEKCCPGQREGLLLTIGLHPPKNSIPDFFPAFNRNPAGSDRPVAPPPYFIISLATCVFEVRLISVTAGNDQVLPLRACLKIIFTQVSEQRQSKYSA